MFYFAYGSNLNKQRMKERCKGAKFLQPYTRNGYKLIFSYRDLKEPYGYANIEKRKNFKVPGAIWKITKEDEKRISALEGEYSSYRTSGLIDYIIETTKDVINNAVEYVDGFMKGLNNTIESDTANE